LLVLLLLLILGFLILDVLLRQGQAFGASYAKLERLVEIAACCCCLRISNAFVVWITFGSCSAHLEFIYFTYVAIYVDKVDDVSLPGFGCGASSDLFWCLLGISDDLVRCFGLLWESEGLSMSYHASSRVHRWNVKRHIVVSVVLPEQLDLLG